MSRGKRICAAAGAIAKCYVLNAIFLHHVAMVQEAFSSAKKKIIIPVAPFYPPKSAH